MQYTPTACLEPCPTSPCIQCLAVHDGKLHHDRADRSTPEQRVLFNDDNPLISKSGPVRSTGCVFGTALFCSLIIMLGQPIDKNSACYRDMVIVDAPPTCGYLWPLVSLGERD